MSMGEMIDGPTINIETHAGSSQHLACELIRRAIEQHLDEHREDLLPWIFSHPAFGDLLKTEPSFVADLGHRVGPPQLLHLMASHVRYPEAVLTLAKHLYLDRSVPAEELAAFLKQHADNTWMWKTLIHLAPSSAKKLQVLQECLPEDLREYWRDFHSQQQAEENAATETNPHACQDLFASQEPAVLRGLARNPHTPPAILKELTKVKDIKWSREIRILAREALLKSSKAPPCDGGSNESCL